MRVLKEFTKLFFAACLVCASVHTALCQDVEQTTPPPDTIYRHTETMPEFPGGMQACMNFVIEKFLLPQDAAAENWQGGMIAIEFIVRANGSIDSVKVINPLPSSVEKEAIRVVQSMPNWKPGTVNGVNVASYFIIPINITLQKRLKANENVQDTQ